MAVKFQTSALLITAPRLDSIFSDLEQTLTSIISRTRNRLVIWIQSPEFDGDSPTGLDWHGIHQVLTNVYLQATAVTHRLDKFLFTIDVLPRMPSSWFQLPLDTPADSLFLKQYGRSLEEHNPQMRLRSSNSSLPQKSPSSFTCANVNYRVVVMGGTFDHLHAGHKILLSMGAFLATEKLIVGMTDDALLTKKAYAEVLEPLQERISKTRAFLNLVKPGIKYDLVPINDVYGPTGWDADIQALVVSKETLNGAAAIRRHRQEHSLPALEEFVIDVISPDGSNLRSQEDLKELKISSTAIRKYLVEQSTKGVKKPKVVTSRF